MPHTRHIDKDGNLVTVISGHVTLEEIKQLQDELQSYLQNKEIYELVIHQPGINIDLDSDDSAASAGNIKKVMNSIKRGAIAFVSNEDYVFGLCRQLQIRAGNEFIRMCVFRTEDTGRKWLNKMRSSQSSA